MLNPMLTPNAKSDVKVRDLRLGFNMGLSIGI